MDFEFTTEVPTRYADVDSYGHVNNAVYATYVEEARIDYLETVVREGGGTGDGDDDRNLDGDGEDDIGGGVAGDDNRGTGIVIANLELEFRQPLGYTDAVTVGVRVPRLGESSIPMEYEIRSGGTTVAVAETTAVAFDRAERESRPIPDAWRERIEAFEGL